jgi:hypothetical protein
MKFPLIYADLCFKQVFESANAGRNSRCRWAVTSASYELQLPLTVPVPASQEDVYDN